MTKQQTIRCGRDVFQALLQGGTPHLLFRCPDELRVGQLVMVEMGSTEKAGQTLTGRITFVTSPGTLPLPANVGIVSIALERTADAPDSTNSAGGGQQASEGLRVDLSARESKAFWDLLFAPDLMPEDSRQKARAPKKHKAS